MSENLAAQFQNLLQKWPRADRNSERLDWGTRCILVEHWRAIRREATRLHQLQYREVELTAAEAVVGRELRQLLQWGRSTTQIESLCPNVGVNVGPLAQKKCRLKDLRIGLGSPAYTGCLPIYQGGLRLDVFFDRATGILEAMEQRGLQVMALPGARIPQGASIPGSNDVAILARGGPEYASVALLWRRSAMGTAIQEVPNLGSNRRLPVCIRSNSGDLTWLVLVYLPPMQSTSREHEWNMEVEGLSRDLTELKEKSVNAEGARIVIMGDINVEPAELGGSDRAAAARRVKWSALLVEHGLAHSGPSSQGDNPTAVWLPLRQKQVYVGAGCTHHCTGRARAIDIIVATSSVEISTLVHNGLHCKEEGGCNWDYCVEYTSGDHFLVEACIANVDVEASAGGSLRMPAWWNDLSRWESGIERADDILVKFGDILDILQRETASGVSRLRRAVAAADWFADAVAWTFMLMHALIMWGWVIPAGMARKGSTPTTKDSKAGCANHDLDWISKLKAMRDTGEISAELMNRLFKTLRPPSLQPPMTLVMNGETMSQEDSHAAWCSHRGTGQVHLMSATTN